ncbi:MAG: YHS domain-containing (seleno)protein [Acidobacteriota bacterium]
MRTLTTLFLTAAFFALPPSLEAQKAEIYTPVLSNAAIKGYDPVAYFTDQKPVKGSSRITHDWKGAEWRFASEANRDKFAADPERWAPQYGGYCAWAVSQGYTAGIDPKAWTVVGDKLYLNYSKKIQSQWEEDRDGNIAKGDANWPKVLE